MRRLEHEATKIHEGEARRSRRTKGLSPTPTPFVHFVLRGLRNLRRLRDPNPYRHILAAMLAGATLKAHRTLDGGKTHILHPLDGPDEIVDSTAVAYLKQRGVIASNMKFPAAVYLLTAEGIALCRFLQSSRELPTTSDAQP